MMTDLQQLQRAYRMQLRDVGCVRQKLHAFWRQGLTDNVSNAALDALTYSIRQNIRTTYEARKELILAARKKSTREFTNER